MKAFLMHRDRDFKPHRKLPPNERDLVQDLELETLLEAMAAGDRFLLEVAKVAVLSSLTEPQSIEYRQHVLADCLAQPAVVREMYDLAGETIAAEKKVYLGLFRDSPEVILARSVKVLELFVDALQRLRRIADDHVGDVRSEGFARLFGMLQAELDDDYFQTVSDHLAELRFKRGTLISAELGHGNRGRRYVLRRPHEQGWVERLSGGDRSGYSFRIADRDESGFKALSELRGRGLNLVADALARSTDHILSFFAMLRTELAFYVACLNLHERLTEKGEPTCFPVALEPGGDALVADGLYDPCLSLHLEGRAVGNDLRADGKRLVIVTGANQGGKSTFLRSVGLAQLMLQCGMLVAAESFAADVRAGVFTHYKREEDAGMESGKLDEELSRMSSIADEISPGCLLLCNESFASTNEREGSEIARQIVRALLESDVKVVFVTHLFDLAHGLYAAGLDTSLFLRAERQDDGRRTYRLVEAEPLPTSFGEDSFRRIFGEPAPAR